LDGYKKNVLSQVNVTLSFSDVPQGGTLQVESSNGWPYLATPVSNSSVPQNTTGGNPETEPDESGLNPTKIV
jgi:hypothetical protein